MTRSDERLLSLTLLSFGIVVEFGEISGLALVSVLLSVALGLHSLLRPESPTTLRPAVRIGLVLALAGVAGFYNRNSFTHRVYLATFAGIAVAILLYSLVPGRAAKIAAATLAAASTLAGIAANMSWGFVDIDVFRFQQEASQALLHGHNPYSPLVSSPEMIGPGVAAWIPLHFPYGPILAVLEAPLRVVGDVRLLHILAGVVTAVAALILARQAGSFDRTACLVMAFPLTIGMVLLSWVDIVTMAGFALWLALFRTRPRVAVITLAVVLGIKPTTLIVLAPAFFWSARARPQILTASGLALLFIVPFAAVTGFAQFYHDVVGIQIDVYPRLDALTINSYLHLLQLPLLPFAASALLVAATTVLVLCRRPATYGDLLTGTAVIVTVSFLVAKWAFFNYYYIPAVLLLLAIAGDGLALDEPAMLRPPVLFTNAVRWARVARWRIPLARRSPGPPGTLLPGPDRGRA